MATPEEAKKRQRNPAVMLQDGQVEERNLRDASVTEEKLAFDVATQAELNAHAAGPHITDHGALTGLADDDHPQYATDADLTAHAAAGDPHTGYRLESADHSHQSTGLQGGTIDHGAAVTGLTDDDHTQYLKERLSGGAESEVPGHAHQATASAGQLDHGLALTGLSDDDHPQYLKEEASGGTAAEVPDHTHASGAQAGTVAHSALTGIGADDHHAQSHSHASHTGIGADDHHAQSHSHASHTGIGADDHHAQAHGAADHTNRTRSMWFPVDAWGAQTGATLTNFGSVPDIVRTREFGAGTDDSAGFSFRVPEDWASGQIFLTVVWAPSNTNTGNAVWNCYMVELTSGDNIATEADAGTSTEIDAGAGVTNGYQETLFNDVNMPTPSAAGVVFKCTIQRQGTAGSDTLTGTSRVLGAFITYTADM